MAVMAAPQTSESTVLIIGLTGAALFLVLQLFLCFKARALWIKLIPVGLLILGGLFCLGTYMGIFGASSAGALSGNGLAAWILGAILAIAAVGEGLAWIVYTVLRAFTGVKTQAMIDKIKTGSASEETAPVFQTVKKPPHRKTGSK